MDKTRRNKIAQLKGAMHLIANGRTEGIAPTNSKKFTRAEILHMLDCEDIDLVYLAGTGLVFVIDANGHEAGRARNEAAGELWRQLVPGLPETEYIAGPCVVCAAPSV